MLWIGSATELFRYRRQTSKAYYNYYITVLELDSKSP